MKPLLGALFVVFGVACACGGLSAQKSTWQPSPGHTQVPLWPGAVPDAGPGHWTRDRREDGCEGIRRGQAVGLCEQCLAADDHRLFAKGKEYWCGGSSVSGGGYQILAIDLEGTEICDWLTSKGITAVLLKYRVPTERVAPYMAIAARVAGCAEGVGTGPLSCG